MSQGKPLVSIGIPVYNGENYISGAIESILLQTFTDFELIISDNASTDRTQIICEDYALKDKRIRYYRNEKNLGASKNFNCLFGLSLGKYFKWAAHDDMIAPDFLEKCVKIMENNPDIVLTYAKTLAINEFKNTQEKIPYELALTEDSAAERFKHFMKVFRYDALACDPIMGLMRSEAFREVRPLGKFIASDMILLCEMALRGKFYEIGEHIYIKRIHPLMSRKKNPTVQEMARWFDPSADIKIQFPQWRLLKEYLLVISEAPISFFAKSFCYYEIIRWTIFTSKTFGADVVKAAIQVYRIVQFRLKPENAFE